jgi:hypothetical protein
MKQLTRLGILSLVLPSLVALPSCIKNTSQCPPTEHSITIETNSPVIEGWNLELKAPDQTMEYKYRWTGPDGWTQHYTYMSSEANQQERLNVTAAAAGEYKLVLVTADGCVEYVGSTIVEVIPAPVAPCTVAANTSTSSVVGVGGQAFTSRYFAQESGHYMVTAGAVGESMVLSFHGNGELVPGVYKTNGYWGLEYGKVGLYINVSPYEFVAHPDQTVYVNKVNNKLEVSFCSLKFNNPLSPANPITISAKIVQN